MQQAENMKMTMTNHKSLYDQLSNVITLWREKTTGDVGSGCPFDAVVVLAARMLKFETALREIAQMEIGTGPADECCDHPSCSACEEMKDVALKALKCSN